MKCRSASPSLSCFLSAGSYFHLCRLVMEGDDILSSLSLPGRCRYSHGSPSFQTQLGGHFWCALTKLQVSHKFLPCLVFWESGKDWSSLVSSAIVCSSCHADTLWSSSRSYWWRKLGLDILLAGYQDNLGRKIGKVRILQIIACFLKLSCKV